MPLFCVTKINAGDPAVTKHPCDIRLQVAANDSESMIEQMSVFGHAATVYDDRHQLRGDAWVPFPPSDLVHHIRSKTARIEAMVQKLETAENDLQETIEGIDDTDPYKVEAFINQLRKEIADDAYDLINYAAFTVRRTRG